MESSSLLPKDNENAVDGNRQYRKLLLPRTHDSTKNQYPSWRLKKFSIPQLLHVWNRCIKEWPNNDNDDTNLKDAERKELIECDRRTLA